MFSSLGQTDGFANSIEDFGGFFAGFVGTGVEDLIDFVRVVNEFFSSGAHGCEVVPVGFGEAFFEVAITTATILVVGDHLLVFFSGGEELVEGEDDGVFGGLGVFDCGGVGLDTHDEFFGGFFVSEDGEGVVVGFGHFFAVESGDFGDVGADPGFGHDEGIFSVEVVDFADEVSGDFEVLLLVFADGNDVGVVEKDIGGHEGGVGKEGVVGGDAFGNFVFIGVAAFEEAHGADGGEDPREFVDFGDGTLLEKDAFGGGESAGEEVDGDAADVFA